MKTKERISSEILNKILSVLCDFHNESLSEKDRKTIDILCHDEPSETPYNQVDVKILYQLMKRNYKFRMEKHFFDWALIHLWQQKLLRIPSLEDLGKKISEFGEQMKQDGNFGNFSPVVEITELGINSIQAKNKIKSLYVVEPKEHMLKYKIIVNESYKKPIEVSLEDEYWNTFFQLVKNKGMAISPDNNVEDLYGYMNHNPRNQLYTKSGCELTRILKKENGLIIPGFEDIDIISDKTYETRKNKLT